MPDVSPVAARRRVTRLAVTAAILAGCASGARPHDAAHTSGQQVTWCAAKAASPEWARQTVYLVLDEPRRGPSARRTDGSRAVLPRPYLALVLEAVRVPFAAATALGPRAASPSDTTRTLPPGEARYRPPALAAGLRFDLLGDGTIDSLAIDDVTPGLAHDSVLAADMGHALRAAVATGELLPYGPPTERHRLSLRPALAFDSTGANWAAFTMNVPRERLVRHLHPSRGRYPAGLESWDANLHMEFIVDTSGRAVAESMRELPAIDSVVWDSPGQRRIYEAFVRTTKEQIRSSRYGVAEYLGCRVPQLVQEPVAYRTR